MLTVKGIPRLERLFRLAAQLNVDKSDLQRYADFVNQKINDLLLRGEACNTWLKSLIHLSSDGPPQASIVDQFPGSGA